MIPENRVIWSSELEHLYGLAAGTFEGTFPDWMKRVVPDDGEQVVSGVKGALARKAERFDYEFRAILPDGVNRWLRGQAQFIYAEDGTPLRMLGVNIDVERTTEALRAEDRRKTQFLATLAHELRNPLAPIRTGLELLKLSSDASAESDEVVETIARQVQQMVRLIDDLLDVSRITQGKIRLRREHCDLRAVLTAALDTSRPNLEANGIELTVVVPAQPIPLDADLTRLAQVFANLLNNAAKYTPRGGSARLSAEISGSLVIVRVRDTGIGIPRDMLEHVFEMFTQVDESIERSHGGLGIGLSLVRALVDMHGGTVAAASDGPGCGSEFTVSLPMAQAIESTLVPTLNGADVGAARGLRIVVVDDNIDAAKMLARLLGFKGHAVTTVHEGARAYDIIEKLRPDLVLLDLGMPQVSGLEVAARIRKSEWGQSIFLSALTGWGQADDRQRTADAGFNHHLVKPVDLDLLAEVLGRVRPANRP
jgi:two-component system CheB/CheR fusion protein